VTDRAACMLTRRALSDTSQRGALDPEEFAVARYLVAMAARGFPPPPALPPQLVPPSKRHGGAGMHTSLSLSLSLSLKAQENHDTD
jgi:hypothetical protein